MNVEKINRMQNSSFILKVTILAIIIKLALFGYTSFRAPEAKFLSDSYLYVESGMTLVKTGTFGRESPDGSISIETYRTPGYPLFLGLLHGILHIPLNGIIMIQIFLTIFSAFIVYAAANVINRRLAAISAIIMLFDLPIIIFSLTLLSETLFLLTLAIFMYTFVHYLKKLTLDTLLISALCITAAIYIRPIAYYLPAALSIFIIFAFYRMNIKKAFLHALTFCIVVYSLLGIWQYRNYVHTKQAIFTSIGCDIPSTGLYKSYARNIDPQTRSLKPLPYYINVTSRCFLSLMTHPGTFKYFNTPSLKAIGKIIGYPWMAFWLIGFIVGLWRLRGNIPLQFLVFVVLYFTVISIVSIMWCVSSRFRVPMMPFIAVISAQGWQWLISRYRTNRQ